MGDAAKLADGYATFKQASFWHTHEGRCTGYADQNPGEAAQIDAYVAALNAGGSPDAPTLRTKFGQGLAAMIAAGFPTVTPPPSSGIWQWPARTATVDPQSPTKMAAFAHYAIMAGTYFEADVAWADAPAGTPTYQIPTNQSGGVSLTAPRLSGLKPGAQNDHTLCIKDAAGVYYDIQLPSFDANGVVSSCDGGAYAPAGSPFETGPAQNSGNAARMALRPCAITPAEIKAGLIPHALHFTMPNVGPGPTLYPGSGTVGYPSNTGLPLGSWVALDPALDLTTLGLAGWELTVAVALQSYGMFCRDIGSTLCVVATDQANQGGNAADWAAAGVNLTGKTPAGVPYIAGFSSKFPWTHLRVLLPPSR